MSPRKNPVWIIVFQKSKEGKENDYFGELVKEITRTIKNKNLGFTIREYRKLTDPLKFQSMKMLDGNKDYTQFKTGDWVVIFISSEPKTKEEFDTLCKAIAEPAVKKGFPIISTGQYIPIGQFPAESGS